MSQTSGSEPPIVAKTVEVLDNTVDDMPSQHHKKEREHDHRRRRRLLSTSTISETTESSLLWTPQTGLEHAKRSSSRRSHRTKHKNGRRLWKEEGNTPEEKSPFLSAKRDHFTNDLCSFERDYEYQRTSPGHVRRSSPRNSQSKKPHKHKQHRELYNDYTRYQYHRRSHKDKNRKDEGKRKKENSKRSGLPSIIQRIKDFFTGKKQDNEKYHRHHFREQFHETSQSPKSHHHHISEKLFRSASDSDIEAVRHHQRHKKNGKRSKDDLYKHGKHWKAKKSSHKLSSIYESSDKTEGLEHISGSDGRLVLARSGSTTYNDIKYKPIKHERSKHREETGTSEGSHSQPDISKINRRHHHHHHRRNKDYRSLRKKWAKQHQSFENDLEKLEKLVKLVNTKKNCDRLEQKVIEDTTLLERLEAKQEKCVAEVDFTRHVLVCKLQRLENKLENSLTTIDNNNNSTEEREKGIEEIREEMSRECRDLRKLLQETSDQLRQVLEEKHQINDQKILEHNHLPQIENVTEQQELKQNQITSLSCTTVPFPELSHHPLNQSRNRLETICEPDNKKDKSVLTRVSTYV